MVGPTQNGLRFQFRLIHLLLMLTVAAIMTVYLWPEGQYDQVRASQVPIVLRIDNTGLAEGSKYIWTEATIITVIKNETGQSLGERVKIAFYSSGLGLPNGVSTVYLLPFNSSDLSLGWKLQERLDDGKPIKGFTHAVDETKIN